MLPPLPWYPKSRLTILRRTQVHDRTSCNVLCDRVMVAGNTHNNIIQLHSCQRPPNEWVHPCPTPLTFGAHSCHPPYLQVVEKLEGFLQPGGHDPHIWPKWRHHLHHHHINLPTVLLSDTPLSKIFTSCPHLPHARRRICSTAGKFLSEDDNVCPKYVKKGTDVSGVPYSKKTPPVRYSVSTRQHRINWRY